MFVKVLHWFPFTFIIVRLKRFWTSILVPTGLNFDVSYVPSYQKTESIYNRKASNGIYKFLGTKTIPRLSRTIPSGPQDYPRRPKKPPRPPQDALWSPEEASQGEPGAAENASNSPRHSLSSKIPWVCMEFLEIPGHSMVSHEILWIEPNTACSGVVIWIPCKQL